MRTLLLLLVLLPGFVLAQEPSAPPQKAPPAKDQVYKWVDKDGVVHYSSQPPVEGAKPARLPPLQTYKGGTNPNLSKFDKSPAKGSVGPGSHIDIVTPSADETFRGGERVVPVAVMVTPQLVQGQKLIYLLDGTPASAPTSDTSYALTGVERGAHTVSVMMVDGSGNELARSQGVTFHMKPPIVGQAEKAGQPPAKPGAPRPTKPKPP